MRGSNAKFGTNAGSVRHFSYQFIIIYLFFFPTGLVRLYIAGLPLKSCRTVGAPSVQGSAQRPFFLCWSRDLNPDDRSVNMKCRRLNDVGHPDPLGIVMGKSCVMQLLGVLPNMGP